MTEETHTQRIEGLLAKMVEAEAGDDYKAVAAARAAIFSEETMENARARDRARAWSAAVGNAFGSDKIHRETQMSAMSDEVKWRQRNNAFNERSEERDLLRIEHIEKQTKAFESIAKSLEKLANPKRNNDVTG